MIPRLSGSFASRLELITFDTRVVIDSHLLRHAIDFGMEIFAPLARWLGLLDGDPMLLGVGILADAGHLPGHFESGRSAGDPGPSIALDTAWSKASSMRTRTAS